MQVIVALLYSISTSGASVVILEFTYITGVSYSISMFPFKALSLIISTGITSLISPDADILGILLTITFTFSPLVIVSFITDIAFAGTVLSPIIIFIVSPEVLLYAL